MSWPLEESQLHQLIEHIYKLIFYRQSSGSTLPDHTQKELFKCISLAIKIGWVNLPNEHRSLVLDRYLFSLLQPTINQASPLSQITQQATYLYRQWMAISILTNMIHEFSICEDSTQFGLPVEYHWNCQKSLQSEGHLLKIFHQVITAVMSLLNHLKSNALTPDSKVLLTVSMQLIVEVLKWDFSKNTMPDAWRQTRSTISDDDLDQPGLDDTPLNPPPEWNAVLVQQQVVLQLLFELVVIAKNEAYVLVLLSSALAKMSTLSTSVFLSDQDTVLYLQCFLNGLMKLMTE
jgi:hypothetical protein